MGDKQSNIRYALYGRMGADCEWMLLSQRIPSYKEALEKETITNKHGVLSFVNTIWRRDEYIIISSYGTSTV